MKTRCAGPTKTTVQATVWTYFLLKEEGKERIKVSSIFVKDMTRDHIGQLTIKHFNILEQEVNRSGIFAARLIFGKQ